jgi:GT2 family glycosyltransferase
MVKIAGKVPNSPKANVMACVVNWSTPNDVWRLVESAEQFEPNLRFSIYQNRPPEGMEQATRDMLDGIGHNRLHRVFSAEGDENRGHGFGTNRAADRAHVWKPKYLFLVNPDCVFTESILDRMVAFLEEDPARCVVGPKQVDSRGRITAGGIIGTLQRPQHRWFREKDKGQGEDIVKCPTVAGSAMLVRTEDFFEYGGLLESKHYYSETWFNYHVQAHGRECWYYGEAKMNHEWHQSSSMGSPLSDGSVNEDRELFRRMCDEHNPPIPRD